MSVDVITDSFLKYEVCNLHDTGTAGDGRRRMDRVWVADKPEPTCPIVQGRRPKTRVRPGQTSRLVMNETDYAGSLDEPRTGGRGQLRIYLGSAAGVGKTFAMLGEGHRRAERGTDVVVAFVETHGRPHTAAQIEGLEVMPRRRLSYRGTSFDEMDIDAVLTRRPEVALVDEFAHTNVPGSRNEKRWQDVEELLEAGIDVISNVNIQHLASLNDVVEKITGVPQR